MARVLITGASRGIGAALAEAPAQRGHFVIATMRRLPATPPSGKLQCLRLDVADPASITSAVGHLAVEPLDILINNAGLFGDRGAGLGRIDDAVWHEVMATNVMGAYRVT